jgi:broad specificity phosphatase PhoE
MNPAVAYCYSEWLRVYKAEKSKGEFWTDASKTASRAYREAMPSLSGQENIRNFVACVAHGMLISAIDGKVGTKLLYAAQVALSTIRGKSAPAQVTAA